MNKRPFNDDEPGSSQPRRLRTFDPTSTRVAPNDHCVPLRLSSDDYTIAWICALPLELAASRAVLDEEHMSLPSEPGDDNIYVLGRIAQHNVVMACLPGQYGTNNAAIVATNLRRSFLSIRVTLMVGIGGGAPSHADDVRLGDVVVGMRVMQYDMGKDLGGGRFQITAAQTIPSRLLLGTISTLRATPTRGASSTRVTDLLRTRLSCYSRPSLPDQLFQASYEHPSGGITCDKCDLSRIEQRRARESDEPMIHFGGIASANRLMRNAKARDEIARDLYVLCFEMEAAGIMDNQCLPIRGICDYSDSHKNDAWQHYAAAVAAAYACEVLEALTPTVGGLARSRTSFNLVGKPGDTVDAKPSERRQQLLDSLEFSQIDARKTTIGAAHNRTCRWFLRHPKYQGWLDAGKQSQNHGFLWIVGKAGAGKSTIMKFAYLETKKRFKDPDTLVASFFFNARGEFLEKSVAGLYRSLLLQLLRRYPDLQAVLDDTDIVPAGQRDWTDLNVLKEVFSSAVLALGQRSFTCFIDALDECDEQEVREMVSFFEELAEQAAENDIQFRVCFSSRPYPYIEVRPEVLVVLENEAGHAEDLAQYVQSRLNVTSPSLLPELQSRILDRAAGIFMWIVLVVEILNQESDHGALALGKKLMEIPTKLGDLFRSILTRDQYHVDRLLLCILWILCAKRPLTPLEFRHALWASLLKQGSVDSTLPENTYEDAARLITSSSKGLAEITKSKQPTVQFIHESVRDFLVKENGLRDLWPDLGLEWEAHAHEKLKNGCAAYLSLEAVQAIYQQPKDGANQGSQDAQNGYGARAKRRSQAKYRAATQICPFLGYASQHILHHANVAASVIPQAAFISDFFASSGTRAINFSEKHQKRKYMPHAQPLYVLADRGLATLVREQGGREPSSSRKSKEETYQHPFFAALAGGHKDTVAALLGLSSVIVNGVDITEGFKFRKDFEKTEFDGRTPLSWAAQEGRLGLARALIEAGEDVNECDLSRVPLVRSMFKENRDDHLLSSEKGAFGPDKDAYSLRAREPALEADRDHLARLRIDQGAVFHAATRELRTVGSLAMAQLLIENGANVNSENGHETPLMFAVQYGNVAVARLLIDKGANIHARDYWGNMALHFASMVDNVAMVRLLLENGADVNARDGHGKTALYFAVRSDGDEALAQLLVEWGADLNVQDRTGETPLMAASSSGNEAAVHLLLKRGADIHVRDETQRTALDLASIEGHTNVSRLLTSALEMENTSGP